MLLVFFLVILVIMFSLPLGTIIEIISTFPDTLI